MWKKGIAIDLQHTLLGATETSSHMKTTAAGKRLLEHFAANCDLDLSVSCLSAALRMCWKIIKPRHFRPMFLQFDVSLIKNWHLLVCLVRWESLQDCRRVCGGGRQPTLGASLLREGLCLPGECDQRPAAAVLSDVASQPASRTESRCYVRLLSLVQIKYAPEAREKMEGLNARNGLPTYSIV